MSNYKRALTLLGLVAFAASILLIPISFADSAVIKKPCIQWGEPGDGIHEIAIEVYVDEGPVIDNGGTFAESAEQPGVPFKIPFRSYLAFFLKYFLWRM